MKWITVGRMELKRGKRTHMATLDTSPDYDGENGWKNAVNILDSRVLGPTLACDFHSFIIHKA